MSESEFAQALAKFGRAVHKEIKGLPARIDWHIYGVESDYLVAIGDDAKPVTPVRKQRIDWETFILIEGCGALQGHMTGNPERKGGGGWSGRFEEKKDMQFIHQLLPDNLAALRTRCGLKYPVLAERCAMMVGEPQCTSAILFFQAFLKSIYRGSTGADAEILMRHLKTFSSEDDPAEILDRWNDLEKRLKAEKHGSIYEVKEGHFHVYEKLGKDRRLINGWLYGIEEKPSAAEEESGGDENSQYDIQLEGASFSTRMKLLMRESERLLGDKSSDLITLIADHKSGALSKLLHSVDNLMKMDDIRGMEPQQKIALKTLADRVEAMSATAARKLKLIEPFGIDVDFLRETALKAQNLKRKLRA